MTALRHSRRLPSDAEVQAKHDRRVSGVRRLLGHRTAQPGDSQHASERPTVPAPKCSVIPGATDDYHRIAKGTLASVVDARPHSVGSLYRDAKSERATPRDLLDALGSSDRVLSRVCSTSELLKARLDPRQGFVLSLVDGETSIDGIVDASPMDTPEVLFVLTELLVRGVIGFER